MKRTFLPLIIGLSTMLLFTGCVMNNGRTGKSNSTKCDEHSAIGQQTVAPTVGQQLIDLQKAKDAGAITDAEYQKLKARLIESK